MIKLGNRIKIRATVGMHSLIGVYGVPPHSWGNYFWFYISESDCGIGRDIRCLNMWLENLEHAVEKFLEDGMVEVIVYEDDISNFCIVDDARIPKEYYYNKLCFNGYHLPPADMAKEIYDYLGDPTYEYEQFVDNKSYWEKRGWIVSENGTLKSKHFG